MKWFTQYYLLSHVFTLGYHNIYLQSITEYIIAIITTLASRILGNDFLQK